MVTLYLSMIDAPQDKRKFEQIYLGYKKVMYFTAYRILNDSFEAEDVVHNAFLRIMDNLDKIDMNDCHKTKSFVVIIVENIAIDTYRKRQRANSVSYDELDNCFICADVFDIDEAIDVRSALSKLPIEYESILRLKYSHRCSSSEIAKILHISESNVRQRISRAKKKLSELLELKGGE